MLYLNIKNYFGVFIIRLITKNRMSTPIEKIEIVTNKIIDDSHIDYSNRYLAEKINEICDVLNSMRVENPYSDNIGKIEYAAPQNIIPPEVVK